MTLRVLREHWTILAVIGLTMGVYGHSIGSEFLTLDDPMLVYENQLVIHPTLTNIGKAFISLDPELYVPITTLSFQLESLILGIEPWHFHAVNLLLHIVNICLVYALMRLLLKSNALCLIVCTLFALHPLQSEAILWVSARKDLLSSLFMLAGLLSYTHYASKKEKQNYWLSLGLFLLSILSKISAVSFPFIILLIDWLLGRRDRCVLKEKAPFFVIAGVFGMVAMLAKSHIVANDSLLSLLLMAPRSSLFYLQMFLWPVNQSAIHLYERAISITDPVIVLSALIIFALSGIAWRYRNTHSIFTFGWTWFLVALAPTFAHYSRGGQFILLGSERYAYIAVLGLMIPVAFCIIRLPLVLRYSSVVLLVVMFGALSFTRIEVFANSIAFNNDILRLHPHDALTHYNLGTALEHDGQNEAALSEYAETRRLYPTYANGYINAGILLADEGKLNEALALLTQATSVAPESPNVFYNLGVALMKAERTDEAISAYRRALSLFEEFPLAHKALAEAYGKKKMFTEAIAEYERLAELDPTFATQLQTMLRGTR